MNANPEKLLTTRELAQRLDVGQDKVRALAREGRIPSVQLGASGRRYEWPEVMAALRQDGAVMQAADGCGGAA